MTRGFVPLILLASLLYAATYLFIKVAVEEISPAAIVSSRLLLAAPVFFVLLARATGLREARASFRGALWSGSIVGVVYLAIPISLIALGEKWVDSGVAAIAIASTPIFVQVLARRYRPAEQASGLRLVGIMVGLTGVGLLTGATPGTKWAQIGGTLAIVGAALCFAVGSLYIQTSLVRVSTLAMATTSTVCGGLVMLPLGLVELPHHVPSWNAIGALLGLTLINSIGSQLLGLYLVGRFGSALNSLSTYLTPPMALLLGILVLGESISAAALAGLSLILFGVAAGSGVLRLRLAPGTTTPVP